MKATALFIAATLVLGIMGGADGAVLCRNASDSVFVRDVSCHKNEQQISPEDLGLGGSGSANPAYTTSRRSIPLTMTPATVAEVFVDAGSYVIHAYAFVNNNEGGTFNAPIICTIESGGGFDFAVLVLQPFTSGTNISGGTLALSSVAELPVGGSIEMQCYNNVLGGNAEINIVRLTATRVSLLVQQ